MAFYDKFPYTNFQEINLDRIIHELVEVKEDLKFVIDNASLKYADPIRWNITKQYQANTVVIDPSTGIAYISTKPVPDNIQITDTNYWTPIFDLSALFSELEDDITDLNGRMTTAEGNITTNTNDIATNANNITTNTNDIATNTANITTNTNNIADLQNTIQYEVPENAKLHGVVGDGVTDDTIALQQVLNNYAWVYLPPGEYLVSSTIILPNNHRLSGTPGAVIKCTSPIAHVMDLKNYAIIEHVNMRCGSADRSLLVRSYNKIHDVHIYESTNGIQVGLPSVTSTGSYMTDSTVYDFVQTGIEFFQSNDCYFSNNIWNAGDSNTRANDCYMNTDVYCEAHTFVNCSFLNGERSLVIAADKVRFNRFANCYFDSSTQVFLNAGHGTSFSTCWFSNRGSHGLLIGGAIDTKLNGCTFFNCSPCGIRAAGSSKGTIIDGCTFAQCTQSAVHMGGAQEIIVSDCVFSDDHLSSGTATPAAFEGVPSSAIITGNILKAQGGAPAAGTNIIVDNNLVLS